jgi:hypothetical protein
MLPFAFDLDNPLPVDDCMRCSLEWWKCICDTRRPNRQPTAPEIEAARKARRFEAGAT